MKRVFTVSLVIYVSVSTYSFGHGGGLDSIGCHHDTRRGGYHCHRGKLSGQSFGSKVEALVFLEEALQVQALNLSNRLG